MTDWKAQLPNESIVRSESSKYNVGTKQKQQIHEEVNTGINRAMIWHALDTGRARDIADEPKRTDHAPCIIVSSGPSLDDSIEYLKDWKGAVICSTSHATTLMYHGIEPTYIVILDPFCAWHEISGVDWSKTKTKIIANPSVWPDIFENWPNEILLFLQNVGRADSYYATTQLHMFCRREPDDPRQREPKFVPLIRTELTLFACTPPAEIFCADILGYGRCILCGVDFAYSPEKSRFTRWQPDAAGVWQKDESPFVQSSDMIATDNGLVTTPIHLYYKKNFLSAWRLSRQELWSTDKWTACSEIPQVSIERVIKDQGDHLDGISKAEIVRRTESYLARVGAYIIRMPDDSVSFIECANPLMDLPRYMMAGHRAWECMRCKLQATAKVEMGPSHADDVCPKCGSKGLAAAEGFDESYNVVTIWICQKCKEGVAVERQKEQDCSGETCPVCGNVGMRRKMDVNVLENMERIKRLVAEADRARGPTVTATPGAGCSASVLTTFEEHVDDSSTQEREADFSEMRRLREAMANVSPMGDEWRKMQTLLVALAYKHGDYIASGGKEGMPGEVVSGTHKG